MLEVPQVLRRGAESRGLEQAGGAHTAQVAKPKPCVFWQSITVSERLTEAYAGSSVNLSVPRFTGF